MFPVFPMSSIAKNGRKAELEVLGMTSNAKLLLLQGPLVPTLPLSSRSQRRLRAGHLGSSALRRLFFPAPPSLNGSPTSESSV